MNSLDQTPLEDLRAAIRRRLPEGSDLAFATMDELVVEIKGRVELAVVLIHTGGASGDDGYDWASAFKGPHLPLLGLLEVGKHQLIKRSV